MLIYRWTNSFNNGIGAHNLLSTNTEWVLFQIGREIQLSKLVAARIKNKYRMNLALPDSLKDNFYNTPAFSEADLFETVMGTFLKFVTVKEAKLQNLKHGKIADTTTFVKSIIYTEIIVEDSEVMIYSKNEKLKKAIKDKIKDKRYTFRASRMEAMETGN